MADPVLSSLISLGGRATIGLVTRRTYRLPPGGGGLVLADQQTPLIKQRVKAEAGQVLDEPDLVILKLATDVVVKGAVFAPGEEPARRVTAAIRVGAHEKRILALGKRRCTWRRGQTIFPEPEPFSSMPLDYGLAYGGSDEAARDELDADRLEDLRPYIPLDLKNANPCVYHRNFVGKGFVTRDDARIDGLELPNLEDPDDLLSPARLIPAEPRRWWTQPMPAGLGWFDPAWFPRSVHGGLAWNSIAPSADMPAHDDPALPELQRGYLAADDLRPKALLEAISEKVINGASPGLVLPHLRGDEQVTLTHLDQRSPERIFSLPGERPRLFLRPLDETQLELQPRLYSVIIDPPAGQVCLVWGGWHDARLPHGPKQLERVPFRVVW